MADFNETVGALFKGLDGFISSKTVVGEAIKIEDGTIILPLVEVSFGVGAGAFSGSADNKRKDTAGGGMGGKITPSSVLVLQNGSARLVNIKNQDTVTKVIDMVPDLIDKFKKDSKQKEDEKKVDEQAAGMFSDTEAKTVE